MGNFVEILRTRLPIKVTCHLVSCKRISSFALSRTCSPVNSSPSPNLRVVKWRCLDWSPRIPFRLDLLPVFKWCHIQAWGDRAWVGVGGTSRALDISTWLAANLVRTFCSMAGQAGEWTTKGITGINGKRGREGGRGVSSNSSSQHKPAWNNRLTIWGRYAISNQKSLGLLNAF